ncbi:agmatinase [candidate division WOR-1 bacterium RIFCSPHIGHO2_01_FULL_53_15]|uniref:Agmatinase n=1 Tax=candidate division WOR-1 bacterium RIFCSPHIGHO2_01_FULL_53_15 TaxID=1802564 RepID=A0A1F4Q0M9_UNCSA|nr:MAG: agmatinase [candidate division WOR-1 bacterium RIFCSPHIGHO2_01_FULL_53_15]OGC10879.1 MAG: agmatinase [candidate division WOR-1 bacterium RIFCSPHIGHO2_02_FULL_53_26]
MFVLLPCPHEATVSYGKGTKRGPAAILKAMQYVENFDEELGREMAPTGKLKVLKPVGVSGLESRVAGLLKEDHTLVILGGEHSITPIAVKAFAKKYRNLSVLQLDAHADLRDSYRGTKKSHACAIRRVLEICPAVQVGIRSLSVEEWEWAQKTGQIEKMHFAPKLELVEKIERQLHKNVYITIDVDVFDPSIIPATGTPEPGGLFWYEVLDILKGVCRTKNVIGFDVVELAPRRGDHASDFTIAKLVCKLLGYLSV